jgi:glyoxylase-like metal-dependent hydrolase (beta-lactamase superfamily II)
MRRREFLSTTAAITGVAASTPLWLPEAFAGFDLENPGHYRFSVGDFEILTISDGNLNIRPITNLAANANGHDVIDLLRANGLPTESNYSHTNLALIDTGQQRVLIDVGSGPNFQDSAGRLSDNLEAAEVDPESIDVVIITHGHPDHIWGLIDEFEEAPRFPNARYIINAAEYDYWTDENLGSKLPEGLLPMALGARRNLLPVAEMTEMVTPGQEVIPGISTIATPGHTPGHMSVAIHSEGESLLITGDALTHAVVSVQKPDWHSAFDADGPQAAASRKQLIDMAVADKMMVLGYHFPFPGLGTIVSDGLSHRFAPAVWKW